MEKILRIFIYLKTFAKKLDEDSINAYAAQAAFFIIISAFPFAMLVLTLLNYIPVDFSGLFEQNIYMLSSDVSRLLTAILSEVYEKATGAVISITTITALWSASKGFLAIIRGLNSVYHVTEKRSGLRLRVTSVFYTIITVGVLIVLMVFLVFGERLLLILRGFFPETQMTFGLDSGMRWILAILLLTVFFMLVYTVVPERKTRFLSELPGAIFSAICWVIFSWGYSFYYNNLANLASIYGSLTSIVILMLWLYICMFLLFLGAEINTVLQNKRLIEIIRHRKTETER